MTVSSFCPKTSYVKLLPSKERWMPSRLTTDEKRFLGKMKKTCKNCWQKGHNAKTCENDTKDPPPKKVRPIGRPRKAEALTTVRSSISLRERRGGWIADETMIENTGFLPEYVPDEFHAGQESPDVPKKVRPIGRPRKAEAVTTVRSSTSLRERRGGWIADETMIENTGFLPEYVPDEFHAGQESPDVPKKVRPIGRPRKAEAVTTVRSSTSLRERRGGWIADETMIENKGFLPEYVPDEVHVGQESPDVPKKMRPRGRPRKAEALTTVRSSTSLRAHRGGWIADETMLENTSFLPEYVPDEVHAGQESADVPNKVRPRGRPRKAEALTTVRSSTSLIVHRDDGIADETMLENTGFLPEYVPDEVHAGQESADVPNKVRPRGRPRKAEALTTVRSSTSLRAHRDDWIADETMLENTGFSPEYVPDEVHAGQEIPDVPKKVRPRGRPRKAEALTTVRSSTSLRAHRDDWIADETMLENTGFSPEYVLDEVHAGQKIPDVQEVHFGDQMVDQESPDVEEVHFGDQMVVDQESPTEGNEQIDVGYEIEGEQFEQVDQMIGDGLDVLSQESNKEESSDGDDLYEQPSQWCGVSKKRKKSERILKRKLSKPVYDEDGGGSAIDKPLILD